MKVDEEKLLSHQQQPVTLGELKRIKSCEKKKPSKVSTLDSKSKELSFIRILARREEGEFHFALMRFVLFSISLKRNAYCELLFHLQS